MSRIFRSSSLSKTLKPRREFDPANPSDVKELKYFIEHSKWRTTCPFVSEEPYEDIPITCLVKYAKHCLKVKK
jgi:hypothetical protein